MGIIIRLAVPADAPDMAQVGARSWEAAYKNILTADYIREKNASRPEQFKQSITDENEDSYVIQKDGVTVGIMKIAAAEDDDLDANYCELHYIYLDPDYFRQGIGALALKLAFDKARESGKSFISVWVFAENENAVKFYEKCGFKSDNKTKVQNRGKPVKIIRMIKNLINQEG